MQICIEFVYKYTHAYVHVVLLERDGTGGCWSQRVQALLSSGTKRWFNFHDGMGSLTRICGILDTYLKDLWHVFVYFPQNSSLVFPVCLILGRLLQEGKTQAEDARVSGCDHKGGQEGTGKTHIPEHSSRGQNVFGKAVNVTKMWWVTSHCPLVPFACHFFLAYVVFRQVPLPKQEVSLSGTAGATCSAPAHTRRVILQMLWFS